MSDSELDKPVVAHNKLDPAQVEHAVSLFMDGVSIAEIARRCNVSRQSIYRWKTSNEWSRCVANMQSDDFRGMACKARAIVRDKINQGDLRTAQWLLARVDPLFWDPRHKQKTPEEMEAQTEAKLNLDQLSTDDLKSLISSLQNSAMLETGSE